jgi:CRP/FNR family transcriptional regulator
MITSETLLSNKDIFAYATKVFLKLLRRSEFAVNNAEENRMDEWIERFEGLASLPEPIRNRLVSRSQIVRVTAGHMIFGPGKSPDYLLLLLDGTVRVHQTSDSGREIVLYRVEAGQSCVLTTACLLANEEYSAQGEAETAVVAVTIPRAVFDDLMAQSSEFRSFVFNAYSRRITDLFRVIDEVAFGRIDMRLAARLVAMGAGLREIKATHQQLAIELGTAREVISRQMHEFQRRGWINQSRGTVVLADRDALAGLAGH